MEWVETTAKTVDEAKDRALDQLGVGADEAEFEVIEEPKGGLFGRFRGEARVRARVKPAAVRPKQDRRQRTRKDRAGGGKSGDGKSGGGKSGGGKSGGGKRERSDSAGRSKQTDGGSEGASDDRADRSSGAPRKSARSRSDASRAPKDQQQQHDEERTAMNDDQEMVNPDEVGAAAAAFMTGLASAFGAEAETSVDIDGTEIDVRVAGSDLGLLVGPGGRTLTAVQDLARVAAQRRLGDHDTRLRIDVGGYREKRREALERFAAAVAQQVIDTGSPKALEPMSSADRKIVHDAVTEIEGVTSRSDGDDPGRRVVISPA